MHTRGGLGGGGDGEGGGGEGDGGGEGEGYSHDPSHEESQLKPNQLHEPSQFSSQ